MTAAGPSPPLDAGAEADDGAASASAPPRGERLGSLKARMALILGLVLLLPAAYAVFQAISVYVAQEGRQAADLRGAAAAVAARQAELLAGVRALLERAAAEPALRDGPTSGPACADALRAALAGWPHNGGDGGDGGAGQERPPPPGRGPVAGLAAVDAAGRVACAAPSDTVAAAAVGQGQAQEQGQGLGEAAWFREVKGGSGPVASEVQEAPGPGAAAGTPGPAVVLAVPLGREGRFAGALAATLTAAGLPAVPAGLDLPPGAVAHLVDSTARLLHPPLPPGGTGAAAAALPGTGGILGLTVEPGRRTMPVDGSGGRFLFAAAPVERERLYALVGLPAPRWSWLERDLVLGLILPVLMLAMAVVGIWIATDYLVNRHVQALAAAARGYASGRRAGAGGGAASWPALRGAPTELRELARVLARTTGELGAREAELEASLAQKELLLREIHHRVKNNLQVVTSLLNLRAQTAASPAARQAMLEAQARVKALALVHRDLYEGGGELLGTVDLRSFLGELCHLLEDTAPGRADGGGGGPRTEVRTSLEPARVAVDKAVPVALFLAEALSNALRHAFPDDPARDDGGGGGGGGGGRPGAVAVRLRRIDAGDGAGGGAARLEVEDDGVGFDPATAAAAATTPGGAGRAGRGLGLTLMRMLAGQAGGRLAIGPGAGGGGTLVGLEFPLAPPPSGAAAG